MTCVACIVKLLRVLFVLDVSVEPREVCNGLREAMFISNYFELATGVFRLLFIDEKADDNKKVSVKIILQYNHDIRPAYSVEGQNHSMSCFGS